MECIRQAREILKGNTRELSELLYQQMQQLSAALKFEEAEQVKQRYMLLQGFVSRSEVVSHTITDVDVFSIIDDEASRNAYINYIHVKTAPSTRVSPLNISVSSMKRAKSCSLTPFPRFASVFRAQRAR